MIIEKHDIIVTTPKSEIQTAKEEADECIKLGGGYYFRKFSRKPKGLATGSKIYYVEDGYLRGFGTVASVVTGIKKCEMTGRTWEGKDGKDSYFAIIPACTWKWIEPILMKGFQGFKYIDVETENKVKVVGNWLSSKPEIKEE